MRVKIITLLLVVALLAGSGTELLFRDRIYPHVYIYPAGADVGGQTREGAALRLRPFGLRQQFRVIALRAGGRAPVLVPADKLGYRIDEGLTAWRAYHLGRSGSPSGRLTTQLGVLLHGSAVPLAQWVDQRLLRDYLFTLAPALNRHPGNGRPGRLLDVARAQQRIARLLLGKGTFGVQLPFTTVHSAKVAPRRQPRHRHYHTRVATLHPVTTR